MFTKNETQGFGGDDGDVEPQLTLSFLRHLQSVYLTDTQSFRGKM